MLKGDDIMYYSPELLNRAIYEVCSHQFKKDCPEAHHIVENAGYEIRKCKGGYEVHSNDTYKTVCFSHRRFFVTNGFSNRRDAKKVNLVNYLNTPYNRKYWDLVRKRDTDSRCNPKIKRFLELRRNVSSAEDRIKMRKEQMARMADNLEEDIQRKIYRQNKLNEYRKEIGLKERR